MDWQIALTAIFITIAAVHVGWRGFRALTMRTNGTSCGGCSGCPKGKIVADEPRLVGLELSKSSPQKTVGRPAGTP